MAPRTTISNLPTDLLAFVVDHVEQEDAAALRCVCRSLRHAVDLTKTHATFHPNVDAAELRSTTRRCKGGCMCSDFPVSHVAAQQWACIKCMLRMGLKWLRLAG
jgi:F-box domain